MNFFSFIKKSTTLFLLSSFLILPVFFLPITRDFFDTNKWMFFVFISLFVLILWAGKLLITNRASIWWSGPIIGLGLLTAASFLSLTVSSVNKMEALLSPLGPITWMAATIILFFGTTLVSSRQKTMLRFGLAMLAGGIGLVSMYQQLGLATMFFPVGSEFTNPFFTPLGSTVSLLTFLILMLPINISLVIHAVRERKDMIAALSVVAATLSLSGMGITIWKFISIAPSQLLPLTTGLQLVGAAGDTIPHILFGVGPEKFFELFTLHRPLSMNIGPLWNIGFMTNASLMLHIATTLGAIGGLSFLFFLVALWKEWSIHPITHIQVILAIIIAFFAPPTLMFIILITLLILSSDMEKPIHIHIKSIGKIFVVFVTCSLSLVLLYCLFRWYSGERYLYQSIQAAKDGNGTKTFMLQEAALKTNPMNATFHMALSQTSLTLAESMANAAGQKADKTTALTDDEKTLLTNLVNRSIQEAKLSVTLAPTNVNAWLNIARVYQGLIGIAKDSDVWATASYQKAFGFDPTNPVLHLDLGGLYTSLNTYEAAGQEYIKAITIKPNYINAWYNLAHIFQLLGDWDNAVKALEQTKSLTSKGSTDEGTLEQEILSVLQEKKTKGVSKQSSTLFVPEIRPMQ